MITIYPAEEAFPDEAHARAVASVFCDELIRNGTTTACVYCAVYPQSVDALFQEALKRNLRLVAGKCMMDLQRAGSTARPRNSVTTNPKR